MKIIIILLIIAIAIKIIATRSMDSLHMVQLEGYDPEHYNKWLQNNKEKAYNLQKNTQPVKKALVFTQRATRLFRLNLIKGFVFYIFMTLSDIRKGNRVWIQDR